MNEEIKTILEEMKFKASIYGDHKKRGLSFNDEEKNCALLLDYIQQKENILNEAREKLKEHKHDLDYEPWSEYKIKGSILFDLVGILDKEDKYEFNKR